MRRIIKISITAVVMALFMTTVVMANDLKVMEIQDNNGTPAIFVKGINDSVETCEAFIGNTECKDIVCQSVASGDISLDTLILIDNSLSIPEKSRSKVMDIISEILAGRSANERFSLATFGEDIEVLIDFTDDYSSLKKTLNHIEFQSRETYLTDVLYDLIADGTFCENEDGAYRRIFVVSDGVDNKSIGYTSNELTAILKETGVPIYALGVYNSKNSNNEQLKNMFAISRETNADSILLDDVKSALDVVNLLAQDRNIVKFIINPETSVKDGSKKTVTLNINVSGASETVIVDDVRMPQEIVNKETVEDGKKDSIDNKSTKESKKKESKKKDKEEITEPVDEDPVIDPKILAVIGAVLVIAIVLIIVIVSKKRKKNNEFKEYPDFTLGLSDGKTGTGETELVDDFSNESNDSTVLLMDDSSRRYTLTLIDINNPARIYSVPIQGKVIIGRKRDETDICIDYDASVSGKHCSIMQANGRFYIENLNRSNGTYVDGERISAEAEVFSGNIIKMGRVQMKIEIS